jgi:hypothetical protein
MTGSPTQLVESITQVVPVPRLLVEGCGHNEANEAQEPKAADTANPMLGMETLNTGWQTGTGGGNKTGWAWAAEDMNKQPKIPGKGSENENFVLSEASNKTMAKVFEIVD